MAGSGDMMDAIITPCGGERYFGSLSFYRLYAW